MTAEKCALDMVSMRTNDVPELARKYAERLFSRSAACMEVLIAAYTTYAIIVEGLPSDPGFLIPTEDELWFREQLEEMPKKRRIRQLEL